jgi:hypothetical protein
MYTYHSLTILMADKFLSVKNKSADVESQTRMKKSLRETYHAYDKKKIRDLCAI